MDLDLPEALTAKIITCTIEGILEVEDLAQLTAHTSGEAPMQAGVPRVAEDPANLKRLRERHHSVARQYAAGTKQSLIAAICGYTESYLSVLLNNPAMQELIEMYRLQQGSSALVIGERLRSVGVKALEAIEDKLDNEEIKDVNELATIAKLGLDRAGHGPSSSTKHVEEQHIIDHARIAELNERAKQGSKAYIVPVREVRDSLRLAAPKVAPDEAN